MIKSIAITNHLNDRLVIDMRDPDYSTGFFIQSITGLDPVKANVNVSDYSLIDGASFNSARIPSRNIVISLGFLDVGTPTIEEIRQSSYKYFPTKKKIKFEIVTDKRNCEAYGYVEKNEVNIFSKTEGSVISIICPDPYFYSAEDSLHTTVFYGVENEFEFEFSNESLTDSLISMGSITNKQEANVLYTGDVDTGVIFNFYARGNVSNISVYNIYTREELNLNIDLLTDDELFVSTIKGNKYVTLLRNGSYYNYLGALDIDNSMWLQISKGDNAFAYTAVEGIENLQLKVLNRILYEGV